MIVFCFLCMQRNIECTRVTGYVFPDIHIPNGQTSGQTDRQTASHSCNQGDDISGTWHDDDMRIISDWKGLKYNWLRFCLIELIPFPLCSLALLTPICC